MGGKDDDQQRTTFVTDYYLSIHYGICVGPVDELIAIWVGDKVAYSNSTCGIGAAPDTFALDNSALFGGNLKEGGVRGTVDWMPGDADQVMTSALASRLTVTPETGPGFRQLASLFFYGGGGFYWASNSPYIKPVSATCMRIPFYFGARVDPPNISGASDADWTTWKSLSGILIDPTTTPWSVEGLEDKCSIFDANPAHIIYEAITNQDWGMGNPAYTLDFASFLASAQTLYDELFGLSMIWSKQTTIEDFVQEVLNHIQAVIFVHPRTGLITLKLIRFDYDRYTVPVYTEYNSAITSVKKRLWSDTINEVVASWTNPFSEEQETVRAQNSANIAIQGGVVSDARNYYGVRNSNLAQTLANRDLSSSSAPLTIIEFVANREAWDIVVGDVVNVISAEYGIESLYVRIDNIDYGKPGDAKIKIVATEDIFAYQSAHFVSPPPDTAHDDTHESPEDFAFKVAFTLPYAAVIRAGGAITDDQEFVSVLGAQSEEFGGADTFSYELWGYPSSGGPTTQRLATRPVTYRALLATPMTPEAETTYPIADFLEATAGIGGVVGGFIYLEGVDEEHSEIVQITAADSTNYTLARGMLDTVPQFWSSGSPAWFLGNTTTIYDPVRRNDGEALTYHLLAITSLGIFSPESSADDLDYTVIGRGHWPTRPANVELDGNPGPYVDLR